jgi:taurine--2-oxoglutarate transaminase
MSQSEVKKYDKEFVVHSWSVQSALDPIVITKTKGVEMWDEKGSVISI